MPIIWGNIVLVMAAFIYVYLNYGLNLELFVVSVSAAMIFTFVFCDLPFLFIYFNHANSNLHLSFSLQKKANTFKCIVESKGKEVKTFLIDDIDKIIVHQSHPVYDDRLATMIWDRFFYYEIFLLNGDRIILSCLVVDDLELYLKSDLFIKRKVFFCMIPDSD